MCQHINVNYQISSRNSVRLFFQVTWSPSVKSISSETGNNGLLKIRTVCASCPVFRPYVLHFRRTVGKDHRVRISKARRIIWQLAGDHNNRLPRVVPCFYDPVEGRILIDGQDIKKVTLESLRHNISPVLQDTFLFNGSIAENIGYARPDASREEIEKAAKAANIHEDILSMPDGYETQVGERGLRLSGGQKQRVAIARAILRNSPIIILDEATASVDVQTERQIQAAISELAGKRTIIAIAHRLSTIMNADLILVIHEGRIVEQGTHSELMALNGFYYKMQQAGQ